MFINFAAEAVLLTNTYTNGKNTSLIIKMLHCWKKNHPLQVYFKLRSVNGDSLYYIHILSNIFLKWWFTTYVHIQNIINIFFNIFQLTCVWNASSLFFVADLQIFSIFNVHQHRIAFWFKMLLKFFYFCENLNKSWKNLFKM